MSNQTLNLDDRLYRYLVNHSVHEPEVLAALRHETAQHPMAEMQIAPEQGQFMALLVQLLGVTKALEIGVFTGYSALRVALALPPTGRLVACDVSEEYTAIARRYWQQAGVADKIDLRIAPAADTLAQLIEAGEANSFDFAFIDADKSGYPTYYEQALQLVRPGGLIAVDNVLWSGRVADSAVTDNRTTVLRTFNEAIYNDDRVVSSLVPIADGLTLAMKKR
ncbi:class I SAM-dependent methyltransferase [Nodosilinea sp. LEGE 07298]|jgi:predicted O-methyltransferase YrrM|uniref:class I SAM-dependent methyltransferase n=1 Tax=Nodosilinea sp. LEGE 07298 TaxID=2777970 RepID=UPI0018809731|nr:class I SAM-dependent methyltransferase [Nodosilinea sp. LEGE 07298]MBE9108778.1 class I SAM-dependent methyltransferase [Nodosilinea sp. LEGE 07298]